MRKSKIGSGPDGLIQITVLFCFVCICFAAILLVNYIEKEKEFSDNPEGNTTFWMVEDVTYELVHNDELYRLRVEDIFFRSKRTRADLEINGRDDILTLKDKIFIEEKNGEKIEIGVVWKLKTGNPGKILVRIHPGFTLRQAN